MVHVHFKFCWYQIPFDLDTGPSTSCSSGLGWLDYNLLFLPRSTFLLSSLRRSCVQRLSPPSLLECDVETADTWIHNGRVPLILTWCQKVSYVIKYIFSSYYGSTNYVTYVLWIVIRLLWSFSTFRHIRALYFLLKVSSEWKVKDIFGDSLTILLNNHWNKIISWPWKYTN